MTISLGRYKIETSNTDKVFFLEAGITKGDIIGYYRRVAGAMLPHITGRPVSMLRAPDGLSGEIFYQKETPDYFPDWIRTVTAKKEGGSVEHVVCDKAADLVYLANQACVTPHVWLSRSDKLDNPDLMVFDLDPSDDDFAAVRFAARACRDILDELGLVPYAQVTGSRGIHVVVPLNRSNGFDDVRAFARSVADVLARRHEDRLTTEQYKNKRGDRVYLDTTRNAYAQTFAPPYSVRLKEGAPVATPIRWDELGDVGPRTYTVENIFRRLGQTEDPWIGMMRHARSLTEPKRRLVKLGG